ncbi:PREDICTED: serine protease 27-like [Papilio polytes]|uniref:serine protease 27-like n=1 Tax=Papilio polytes TaxID=76194 RepID=UPI000676414E|nr:PREDICTED: serine protease 27-like [Papilio polytes]
MAFKVAALLATLLATSLAVPTPQHEFSDFFIHADPNARIVGGSQAPVGSVPYMVAMSNGLLVRSFLCGGSLISARHVLTAAHCIEAVFSRGALSSSLRVTVGTNRWNSGGQSYSLSRNVTHPNYVSRTIKNDIGILVTSSNVAFTNLVQPVVLSYDHIGAGVRSKAAGWGRIRQNGSLSAALLQLIVTTIDGQQCIREVAQRAVQLNIRAPAVEPHIELCTFHSANHGMCNGDSGSALVNENNGRQIGIVSWGLPCARDAPDMFVRVSAFRDWIIRSMASIPTRRHAFSDLFIHAEAGSRVVGGTPAPDGSVPYMVAMSSGLLVRSFICGGSLISTRHIMTAAHCIDVVYDDGVLSGTMRVTVGTNRWMAGGQSYGISHNFTHPEYNLETIRNDIGIMVTSTEVVLSNDVQPVGLSFDFIDAGVRARGAGWGRLWHMGPLSAVLMELVTTTVDAEQCVREVAEVAAQINMPVPPVDPHTMLCVFHSAERGMCNGDSGSALVNVENNLQIGFVSWGLSCARGAPDMYVRLSTYKDWVASVMD